MGILRLFFLLAFALIRFVAGQVGASSLTGMDETVAIQREGLQRLREFLGPSGFSSAPKKRAEEPTIMFSNPAAQQFFVDGTSIPDGGSSYTESPGSETSHPLHILSKLRRRSIMGRFDANKRCTERNA